jgi:hypothetical protein
MDKIKYVPLTYSLKSLKNSRGMQEAFPGRISKHFPQYRSLRTGFPELYKDVIAGMKPGQMVIVAMPDQLHYLLLWRLSLMISMYCVLSPVLKYDQSMRSRRQHLKRSFVGEYHKRFDRRSLMVRSCELKQFSEFVMGEAKH